jgi:hypothetical protein
MDADAEREDRRDLIDVADELLVQAAEIRRHWSELAVAVGVEAPADLTGAGPEAADDEVRRLVAIDMLLSNRSRDEIVDHLRRTFGDDGVEELVDAMFAEYGGT